MNYKNIATKYRDFILEFSGFLMVTLVFFSGIGRYRFVLIYAGYCLIKALSALIKVEQRIYLFFFPAIAIALFLDLIKGPIFPLFTKNYLIIALLIMMVVDKLIRNLFKKLIADITLGQFFVVCPSCNYDNKDLVEKCLNCFYKKDNQLRTSAPRISPVQDGAKMPHEILNFLSLGGNEEILFHKKISRNLAVLKNGERQVRKHFVITTANIILLDYYGFHIRIPDSWRERDIIPLSNIIAAEGKMKNFYLNMRPFLIIRTDHNDTFELVFSIFGKYIGEINNIISIIKKANPHVMVDVNLTEPHWKHIL